VQEALWIGSYTAPGGSPTVIDGVYGPQTAYAVRQFQRRHNLIVDGKVGPQTWRALARATCDVSTEQWSLLRGRFSPGPTGKVVVARKAGRITIGWWELGAYGVAKPGSSSTFRACFRGEGTGGLATVRIKSSRKTFTIRVKRGPGSALGSFTETYRKIS
jgi:hypothetical protein